MSRPYIRRPFGPREPLHKRNGKIRAREVRVIDENKQPLGVMLLGDALKLAQNRLMDLIEVAPNATPPVCRILEYGKFLYEESKKKKDSPSSQSGNRMKELQLSANIDPNDFRVKLARAVGFLCADMKVRVKLRFRGRQRAHKEFGFDVMNKFVQATAAYGRSDCAPKMAGDRDLHVTINPLPRDQRAKAPDAEPGSVKTALSAADDPGDIEEIEDADDTDETEETVAPTGVETAAPAVAAASAAPVPETPPATAAGEATPSA
ncbi:MAG: translation initiation factor IF-3 [Verrucomicrobia bacterium]|nr:MAG: translation initiation factor IF-3 [Verrucomicrobiota bacterium]